MITGRRKFLRTATAGLASLFAPRFARAQSATDILVLISEAGANSVVRKSLDYNELRRKMKQVYDFWITVNEANRNSRV